MNGRIYDPLLGRFLSADIVVQNPGRLQSFNRYSYVLNNPLTNLDPTGFYSILGLEFRDGGGISGFAQDIAGYQKDIVVGAAQGAVAYGKGLVQGAVASVEGTASAIAHPIDAVQGAADGLGTLAGRAIFDTKGLVSDIKNTTVETLNDPNKLGQVVGKVVTDTLTGEGAAKLAGKAIDAGKSLAKLEDAAPVPKVGGAVPEPAPTGGMCFEQGTLVSTPSGLVRIEEIRPGDTVLAYDFDSGEEVERTVLETPRSFTHCWIAVGIGGEEVKATVGHRFWIESEGSWVRALDLEPGMTVRLADGRTALVDYARLIELSQAETTYNLVVDVSHNYFVSGLNVLVHNGTPLDEKGHWNYHLEDASGNTYYHGRAGPNQTQPDVEYRHSKTGDRFTPGKDKLVPDTENVTYGESRVNEHIGIEKDGTNIGRGGETQRGKNKVESQNETVRSIKSSWKAKRREVDVHSDPCTEASDGLSRVTRAFEKENGRLPTAKEAFDILALAIRTSYDDLFADISNYQVDAISWTGISGKKKRPLAAGDVFGVRLTDGLMALVMYVGTIKPFGDFFVCFKGEHQPGVNLDTLKMAKYSFRSSKRLIDRDEWRFFGNRWDLAVKKDLFAEAFYNKTLHRDREDVGPFGSAKRLERDGTVSMRDLSEMEAREIGILGNRDDMGCQPDLLETFIRGKGWLNPA